jgi:hypothetical protein
MTIITLPSAARIRRVEWTGEWPAQVNRSDWTKRRQVVTQPGPFMWSASCELVVKIGEADMLDIEAFLIDLEGPVNSFRLKACENAQAPAGFAPIVDGGGQSGRTIALRGGTPGVTLRRGHKFTVNDQLLVIMAPATFGLDGKATLSFKPSLRVSPADGTAVEARWPTALVSITGSQVGWSVDPGELYQAKALALEEAF